MENSAPEHADQDGDGTRLRLLDAAVALFAESGFAGTSVRRLCDAAAVKNIGAINYHFRDKEGLYREAVQHALCFSTQRLSAVDWPADLPAAEKLRHFVRGMVVALLGNPNPAGMALVMREFAKPTPVMAEVVRANIKPMADRLHGILEELLPKMEHERRVLVGLSIVGQCLYYHQNRPVAEVLFGKDIGGLKPEAIAAHIADFSLAALGFAPPLVPKSGGKR